MDLSGFIVYTCRRIYKFFVPIFGMSFTCRTTVKTLTFSFSRRNMQSVFDEDPLDDFEPDEATPPPKARGQDFLTCGNDAETTGSVTVKLTVGVETTGDVNDRQIVLDTLQSEVMQSLYYSTCRRKLSTQSLRSRRRLEITSFTEKGDGTLLGDCDVTSDRAEICQEYETSLIVAFSDEQENAVASRVLEKLQTDIEKGLYNPAINEQLDASSQVTLTRVISATQIAPKGTTLPGFQNFQIAGGDEDSGLLSNLGKGFVPIAGLLFVLMVAFLLLARRQRRSSKLAPGKPRHLQTPPPQQIITHVIRDRDRNTSLLDQYADESLNLQSNSEDDHSFVSEEESSTDNDQIRGRPNQEKRIITPIDRGPLTTIEETRSNKSDDGEALHKIPSAPEEESLPEELKPSIETKLDDNLDSVYCTSKRQKGIGGWFKKRPPTPFNQTNDAFEDEPKQLQGVSGETNEKEKLVEETFVDNYGVKRSFVDREGYVRNEIEL